MPRVAITPEERINAIVAAGKRAKHLEDGVSTTAIAYLDRLAAMAPERTDAGYLLAINFNDWLMKLNAAYLTNRDHAGLPPANRS
jgi:hypothetical protein